MTQSSLSARIVPSSVLISMESPVNSSSSSEPPIQPSNSTPFRPVYCLASITTGFFLNNATDYPYFRCGKEALGSGLSVHARQLLLVFSHQERRCSPLTPYCGAPGSRADLVTSPLLNLSTTCCQHWLGLIPARTFGLFLSAFAAVVWPDDFAASRSIEAAPLASSLRSSVPPSWRVLPRRSADNLGEP